MIRSEDANVSRGKTVYTQHLLRSNNVMLLHVLVWLETWKCYGDDVGLHTAFKQINSLVVIG